MDNKTPPIPTSWIKTAKPRSSRKGKTQEGQKIDTGAEVIAKPFRFKGSGSGVGKGKKRKRRRENEKENDKREQARAWDWDGEGVVVEGDIEMVEEDEEGRGTGLGTEDRGETERGANHALGTAPTGDAEQDTGCENSTANTAGYGSGSGTDDDGDQAAFEEMIRDALDTDEGALTWERVFGEKIADASALKGGRMGWKQYVAGVMGDIFSDQTVPNGRQDNADGTEGVGEAEGSGKEGDEDEDDREGGGTGRKQRQRQREERQERHRQEQRRQREAEEEQERHRQAPKEKETPEQKEAASINRRIANLIAEAEAKKLSPISPWLTYLRRWRAWNGAAYTIPWPVSSGHREDVSHEGVRVWFEEDYAGGRIGRGEFWGRVKGERVRWHPDRFSGRFGDRGDGVVEGVTVVFQALGGLYEGLGREEGGR